MTPLAEVKSKLQRKWYKLFLPVSVIDLGVDSGVDSEQVFPYRLGLKKLNNRYIADNWQDVKTTAQSYLDLKQVKVKWQVFHTDFGKQQLPVALEFANLEQVANWLQRKLELKDYRIASKKIIKHYPQLKNWCLQYAEKVLKYQKDWARLLLVIEWFLINPSPRCYLREICLPKIDSKFIEQYKKLLAELLTVLRVDDLAIEKNNFEQKLGIKTKPNLLRLRFLGQQNIAGLKDIQTPLAQWQQIDLLALGIKQVFITENEINFLSFPKRDNSVVIFGKGYGFSDWNLWDSLKKLPIYYWGDIDTHGFAILNQLRMQLSQTKSILMDEKTLLTYKFFWGIEQKPTNASLLQLTLPEQQLYKRLVNNHWQEKLRLEQERVDIHRVYQFLLLESI